MVGGLKNPWGTHRIDLYDFWVILKIECFFSPENLSIGCCAAILNRDVFDLFDLFSIGSCAAILNRDLFDLFDFFIKKGVQQSRVLSKNDIFDDFKGYRIRTVLGGSGLP